MGKNHYALWNCFNCPVLIFDKYHFILGSASPRRKQLLGEMRIDFEQISPDVEEHYDSDLMPAEVPVFLAELKANAFHIKESSEVLICADTVVEIDGELIQKPVDESEAIQMINRLSGREHRVISGVCIKMKDAKKSFAEETIVGFDALDQSEIEAYVRKFQPFDKAGSYGIQEWIGYIGISYVKGCYYNVMGLPTHRLYKELKILLR